MPTNLPPEYFRAEERYRSADSPDEKIVLLEKMIATIPKHKGTDKLRADLRRKLARMKEAARVRKKTGGHESLFHVEREGAGRVLLVGPPNSGKSALLAALTGAEPKISDSPYTTWSAIPGMMIHEKIQIQLIDTPPLSREHIEHELMDLARTADMILVVLDLCCDPLKQLQETAEILVQNGIIPHCGRNRFGDSPHAVVLPFLVVVNKTDSAELDEDFHIFCDLLEEEWPLISISGQTGRNLDKLKQEIFTGLQIIRVYAKPPGQEADFSTPFAMRQGDTVEDFAARVHKDFVKNLKTARIWGKKVYDGQPAGRDHLLEDGDVVELHT